MLRAILLLASVASIALAGVADVCAQHPYQHMHHFKGYAPAQAHCAAHYPVHVVTKTASARCLTTTKNNILSTETVIARRTQRCSTTHHHPPDESMHPVPTYGNHHQHHHQHHAHPYGYHNKRDAAPEPTAMSKRDHSAKAREWAEYHGELAKCGYECIRKACSCAASRKTVTVFTFNVIFLV